MMPTMKSVTKSRLVQSVLLAARIMNGGGSGERKSEKERKKNERRQESKAAKTLSAILFAFILTWTPYNG